jgi:uncharacterized protein YdeI (YjbR/CyaY-like superfamily)
MYSYRGNVMTETYKDLPVLFFEDQATWHQWLDKHCTDPTGVWLKFAKKSSGITSLNYAEALDEALCYGWIDGQAKSVDEIYYLQRFVPRRPKGMWSKRNIAKVAVLTDAGKMKPTGIAQVEAAKADGRWDQAYDAPTTMVMPEDFAAALSDNPKAKAFYETLNKTNTYAILWRVQTARTPATRKARIEKLISMLNNEEKLHI